MPKLSTHLNLALILGEKIKIQDLRSLFLGAAYPDVLDDDDLFLKLHFKKTAKDLCDLKTFLLKVKTRDNFSLGHFFHLYLDNVYESYDFKDIKKYDALICDMQRVIPYLDLVKIETIEPKKKRAIQNIKRLDLEPIPLYMIFKEQAIAYEEILEKIVADFLKTEYLNFWCILINLSYEDRFGY